MAAIVRVKRSLDEEPSCAFVLSCKRRKTDANDEDPVETVFRFAGTVKDQEENFALLSPEKHMKNDVKASCRPIPNVSKKVRFEAKALSQSNRYKLVNYFRTHGKLAESSCEEDGNQNSLTVFDVEASVGDNNSKKDSAPQADANELDSDRYVYDLYYIQPDKNDLDVDDLLLDGLVSFAPIESELVFDSYRNNRAAGQDSDSDTPLMDDDDDSNDENNWRNDYPDDEEGESEEESGLIHGFGKIRFGDEELSSDEDDEKLIYTEELSPSEVNMFGSAYASFKKKAVKEMNLSDEINSNSDEECYANSESDSDEIDGEFE